VQERVKGDIDIKRESGSPRGWAERSAELYPRTFKDACVQIFQKTGECLFYLFVTKRECGLQIKKDLFFYILSYVGRQHFLVSSGQCPVSSWDVLFKWPISMP
jgi:hypothetical protein